MADKEDKKVKKSKEPKPASFETVEKPVEIEKPAEAPVMLNGGAETLGLLMDVELELTAQMGGCELPIKNVLDFAKGTIIELDSYTNKPIDLLANGKVIAKGEVVIIQDNFGLRITNVSGEAVVANLSQNGNGENGAPPEIS